MNKNDYRELITAAALLVLTILIYRKKHKISKNKKLQVTFVEAAIFYLLSLPIMIYIPPLLFNYVFGK